MIHIYIHIIYHLKFTIHFVYDFLVLLLSFMNTFVCNHKNGEKSRTGWDSTDPAGWFIELETPFIYI